MLDPNLHPALTFDSQARTVVTLAVDALSTIQQGD